MLTQFKLSAYKILACIAIHSNQREYFRKDKDLSQYTQDYNIYHLMKYYEQEEHIQTVRVHFSSFSLYFTGFYSYFFSPSISLPLGYRKSDPTQLTNQSSTILFTSWTQKIEYITSKQIHFQENIQLVFYYESKLVLLAT